MGKRRKTAKTGDKSLYKKAAQVRSEKLLSSSDKSRHDDSMYDDVDHYHNQKDEEFMKFNNGDDDEESNDDEQVEAVMDLGVGGDSSQDEEDDDDENSESDDESSPLKQIQKNLPPSDDSDDDNDDEDEEGMEDIRDWGRKKSSYYHGDTADLELGQDEEDAFLEEEAAKEVQAARYEDMAEEDFLLSDGEEEGNKAKGKTIDKEIAATSLLASIRDVSKLSNKDKRRLIEKQHPGLLQIISYFSEVTKDLKDRTSSATSALCDGDNSETTEAIGATRMGKKYLLTKALIQSTAALNFVMFLLLKAEEYSDPDDLFAEGAINSSMVQFHPVMKRLQQWNALLQKMKEKVEDNVDGLQEQLDSLIQASEMMASLAKDDEDDDKLEGEELDTSGRQEEHVSSASRGKSGSHEDEVSLPAVASSSESELSEDEEAMSRKIVNDARFGLRPNELVQDGSTTGKSKRRRVPSDFGDDKDATNDNKSATRYLSSALNTIEQRTASKRKKRGVAPEDLVDHRAADDELRRGVEMMEEELGKAPDDDGSRGSSEGNDAANDSGFDDDDDGEGAFYSTMSKKSKAKREFKKSLYKVAPKYPRMEGEVEGERAISRTIMKNRGLVPHKNKLNRNPRVKKREQYRKALIRRKGSVREVRKDEGHKYGGEETGIKTGISRSRKLGTN